MANRESVIAANRFGLGPKPGELDRISPNPRQWLLAQLTGSRPLPRQFDGFMNSAQLWDTFIYRYSTNQPIQAAQREARRAGDEALFARLGEDYNELLHGWVTWAKENFLLENGARTNVALTTDEPFRERLVHFWSNHLVVPNGKQQSTVLLGSYEREVIRPHVTGKFSDMLLAAAKHPAMLAFLDNNSSVGPRSVFGQRESKGLNENLAREILELHTLGVDGGYSQEDVISLANGITGWSVFPMGLDMPRQRLLAADRSRVRGRFNFYEDWHEPGAFTLLGKTYSQSGIAQGEAMLNDLARHPKTARFLATKLARHFVSDDPPELLIARLANVYLQSDTNLGEVAKALVGSSEAWDNYGSKLKQPIDYVYSVMRTLGMTIGEGAVPAQTRYVYKTYPYKDSLWVWAFNDQYGLVLDPRALIASLNQRRQKVGFEILRLQRDFTTMGQPLQVAPGPQGWYDKWSDWSGPDSLVKRVEWALKLAEVEGQRISDPRQYLTSTLGPLADEQLSQSVANAATTEQGLGMVIARASRVIFESE
jgi:uncharacterized protein (DUF1800 family)